MFVVLLQRSSKPDPEMSLHQRSFEIKTYSAQWDKLLINGGNDFFSNMHTLTACIKYHNSD